MEARTEEWMLSHTKAGVTMLDPTGAVVDRFYCTPLPAAPCVGMLGVQNPCRYLWF